MIDVREPSERDAGYIPGSRNIPYRVIGEFADDLAGGKPLVTICETGARARRSRPACSPRPASRRAPCCTAASTSGSAEATRPSSSAAAAPELPVS